MYVILWEFLVRPENLDTFLAAYSKQGAWDRLFSRAEGYLDTELLRSADSNELRFLTLDRWQTAQHFSRFQQQFAAEYRALDAQTEALTVSERRLGDFTA